MAKLKNFTLEGEYMTLIAHLDFDTGKPVIDLVPGNTGKPIRLQDGYMISDGTDSVLSAIPAQTFERIAEALSDDLFDLCRCYKSTSLIERFAKEWGGEEDAGTQSGDESGEDA